MRPRESYMDPNKKQNWLIIVYNDEGHVIYQHSAQQLTEAEADALAAQLCRDKGGDRVGCSPE